MDEQRPSYAWIFEPEVGGDGAVGDGDVHDDSVAVGLGEVEPKHVSEAQVLLAPLQEAMLRSHVRPVKLRGGKGSGGWEEVDKDRFCFFFFLSKESPVGESAQAQGSELTVCSLSLMREAVAGEILLGLWKSSGPGWSR